MELSSLEVLSPLDGRYRSQMAEISNIFSEYSLIKHRVQIECRWLLYLINSSLLPELNHIPESDLVNLEKILEKITYSFSLADAQMIKNFERTTQHDLKAVEYFIKQKLQESGLSLYREFIHFGCTSEDINNLAYALMLQEGVGLLFNTLSLFNQKLQSMSVQYAKQPMLARTHGQAATPTTLGKEIANYHARFSRQLKQIQEQDYLGKFGGAVGSFNAHAIAYPNIDWPKLAEGFVSSLGLSYNPLTTQIEPHDFIAEIAHNLFRINTILIDFDRNIWGYISLGYFSQKSVEGEVGSSTMPHKINPIQFENSEGNLGIANALFSHMAEKLPISRFQRDLSDSTVLRNLGVALGHSYLAYQSSAAGLQKLQANPETMEEDLNNNPAVLTEAIQTLMRRYQQDGAYEQLKNLSRGKEINLKSLHDFIRGLTIPTEDKKRLLELTPATYLGWASHLALVHRRQG